MEKHKKKFLEKKGWKVASVNEFLELTAEEAVLLDLKILLGEILKERRSKKQITQMNFAKMIGSSQSRVAKMEAGDPSVTLDLLFRSLVNLGLTRKELAKLIA